MAAQVRRIDLHPAPTRPILYFGVERPLAAGNAMLALVAFIVLPPGLLKVLIPLVVLTVLLPLLRLVTRRDPRAAAMYSESLAYQDYYPPSSATDSPTARFRPFRSPERLLL